MSYDESVSDIVKAVEAAGIAIMIVGGVGAFAAAVPAALDPTRRHGAYQLLRRNLGRAILLGLELLIMADIVRTLIVSPTFESVVVLGVIVVIRIVLSFSLEVEIEGVWPWNRRPGSSR
jgi:uncharacterized membrane protein